MMDSWYIFNVDIFMKLTTLWKVMKLFQKGLFVLIKESLHTILCKKNQTKTNKTKQNKPTKNTLC